MSDPIRLNLGCGYQRMDGYVNIDCRELPGVDLVHNVANNLPFADGSVEEVYCRDFLEHIPIGRTIYVISEIWRVLISEGKFEHITPSTDGRGAFQDPTHISFWNRNSWFYYTHPTYRGLYDIQANFRIQSLEDHEEYGQRHLYPWSVLCH